MSTDIPAARIAGRHGRHGGVRGFAIAAAVGAAATVASWSLLLALTIAGIGIGVGGLWLFRLYLEAGASRAPVPAPVPPTGDREYSLRPRAAAMGVLVLSLSFCLVVIRWPELWSISAVALLALSAILVSALFLVVFIRAAVLRPRIVVTDTHITLPRSDWSSEVDSIALADVRLRIWGPESSPILEISSAGHKDYDVGMTFLGESPFRELVAVIEHRHHAASGRSAGGGGGGGGGG